MSNTANIAEALPEEFTRDQLIDLLDSEPYHPRYFVLDQHWSQIIAAIEELVDKKMYNDAINVLDIVKRGDLGLPRIEELQKKLDQIMPQIDELGTKLQQAMARNILTSLFISISDIYDVRYIHRALQTNEMAFDLLQDTDNLAIVEAYRLRALIYTERADVENKRENLDNAMEACNIALNLLDEGGKIDLLASMLFIYANIHTFYADIENRDKHFTFADQMIERALEIWNVKHNPIGYGKLLHNRAWRYDRYIKNNKSKLIDIINLYQLALRYRTPRTNPQGYATTMNNLGYAYSELTEIEDKQANLHRAIEVCQNALIYRTPEQNPQGYANTMHNLGNRYASLAEIEDKQANLHRAIEACQNALIYHTPEQNPQGYANTMHNLGNRYASLAKIEDKQANLHRAIEAYQNALIYHTPEQNPQGYANTMHNLGIRYASLAEIEDKQANLHRAIEACQNVLIYRTPEQNPQGYANTMHILGYTYSVLAEIEDKQGNLHRAIEAYQNALIYRTPEKNPQGYAVTMHMLGYTYSELAEIEDKQGNLHRAIEAYQNALIYRTPEKNPQGYAMTMNNLGYTYSELAKIEDKQANLHRTIEACQNALIYRTPENDVGGFVKTSKNLAKASSKIISKNRFTGRKSSSGKILIEHYDRILKQLDIKKHVLQYAEISSLLAVSLRYEGVKQKKNDMLYRSVDLFRASESLYSEHHGDVLPKQKYAVKYHLAEALADLGEMIGGEKADALYNEAIGMLTNVIEGLDADVDRNLYALAHKDIGSLYEVLGDGKKAARYWGIARSHFSEIDDFTEQRKVDMWLREYNIYSDSIGDFDE